MAQHPASGRLPLLKAFSKDWSYFFFDSNDIEYTFDHIFVFHCIVYLLTKACRHALREPDIDRGTSITCILQMQTEQRHCDDIMATFGNFLKLEPNQVLV